MMLLNFKDVEELRLIYDAMYVYLGYMDYLYDMSSNDKYLKKSDKCIKLIEQLDKEIEYYEIEE